MPTELWVGLCEALKHGGGEFSPGDLLEMIIDGRSRLWTNAEKTAAIVTDDCSTRLCRQLSIWLAAGDMAAVLELSQRIEEEAAAAGYDRLVFCGRRGWERVLKDRGWRFPLTHGVKELR